ncbi:hypothetical protein C8F04DRAFT_1276217 [Mycena alexandri]|uniref:Uncharacterized protein n=1 Tax=Mycena alexandri TaxID=1745969 RepID=A0AAD6S1F5_9AGAR|nr:hypothetical protein C8F04DRAFT_1276217 [Mycena alexandri]
MDVQQPGGTGATCLLAVWESVTARLQLLPPPSPLTVAADGEVAERIHLPKFDCNGWADPFPNKPGDVCLLGRPVVSRQVVGVIHPLHLAEVPRDLVRPTEEPVCNEDKDLVIYNPVGYFLVYQPSADRVAQIKKEHAEINKPLSVHYDTSAEVRAQGAGFYQFSHDEETRKGEVEKTHKETGAVDVLPGEVEGMALNELYKTGIGIDGTVQPRLRRCSAPAKKFKLWPIPLAEHEKYQPAYGNVVTLP